MLTIQDRVYGSHTFTSPVLVELINSTPLQRLKGISQLGPPDKWYFKKGFFRFEHSIGVTILLAKLGAPLKVQVAGLLHDTGHTAFSHVSDWLFGDPEKEDLNDQLYFQTISTGEIGAILRKHKILPTSIKNIKDFPLLKQNIPHLCADTIDYCLREMVIDKDVENAQKILTGLTNFDGKIAFTSESLARDYANEFLRLDKETWANWKSVTIYSIMKKIFLIALKNNIINKKDFSVDDNHILNKLYSSQIPEIMENIKILEDQTYQPIIHPKKKRFCDPEFIQAGNLVRLSTIDKEFLKKISEITA